MQTCGGVCTHVATNPQHCGGCNMPCGMGETCNNGVCEGAVAAAGTGGGGAANAGTAGTVSVSGSGTAGVSSGGTAGTSGGTSGGAGTGGTTAGAAGAGNPGDPPPGYWSWGDWHGCSWTGVDVEAVGTTITPQDFVSKPPNDAYCVSGSVGPHPDYESVALLGFNIAEPPPADCAYVPVDPNSDGPPSTMPLSDGIAVDFVKQGSNTSFTWRVQVQGPNGHKDGDVGASDRWCATITEVQGKVFIPYNAFTPSCWELEEANRGTPYAGQPISAVVFLVPGSPEATPFDFCVNGFAYGTSAADAPDGPAVAGDQIGVVGGANNDDLDFDRTKIVVDGKEYIIHNNNWGNPSGSDVILDYVNNSFTVSTANGSGSDAPASFPSIFIGNNGNTANGVLGTANTDNLRQQISAISSINSTLTYASAGGQYNVAYDMWFANSVPTTEYQDGIDGFVMVWLHDPSGKQPIGSMMGSTTIQNESWNIWVGPRGDGPAEGGNPNAPVVSFVNPSEDDDSRASSFVNRNLMDFIRAAEQYGISSSMYITDVFGGFEIWNGGQGLKLTEFTAVVQ